MCWLAVNGVQVSHRSALHCIRGSSALEAFGAPRVPGFGRKPRWVAGEVTELAAAANARQALLERPMVRNAHKRKTQTVGADWKLNIKGAKDKFTWKEPTNEAADMLANDYDIILRDESALHDVNPAKYRRHADAYSLRNLKCSRQKPSGLCQEVGEVVNEFTQDLDFDYILEREYALCLLLNLLADGFWNQLLHEITELPLASFVLADFNHSNRAELMQGWESKSGGVGGIPSIQNENNFQLLKFLN